MERKKLSENIDVSRLVHGYWRLADWNLSTKELTGLINQVLELGITTFDHADIYGDYSCEILFGKALTSNPQLRNKIQLISKCGIALLSDKFPSRRVMHYDYSFGQIVKSVNNSLKNFGTDHLDLLLLHRPAPFFDPEEVAKAFDHLYTQGKCLGFGVSNFLPAQFEMLSSYLNLPLVTNQVEISPLCLEHFENGNIDFFLKKRIVPMAWSPLGGGSIFSPKTDNDRILQDAMLKVANEMNIEDIAKVAFSWLLTHPANIVPILGTGNIERIKHAVEACHLQMNLEQWYEIYVASSGKPLP